MIDLDFFDDEGFQAATITTVKMKQKRIKKEQAEALKAYRAKKEETKRGTEEASCPDPIDLDPEVTCFYNSCHGASDGKFCPTHGGKGGSGGGGQGGKISGHFGGGAGKAGTKGSQSGFEKSTAGWPSRDGRKISTVASAGHFGTVKVDGINAKAVYEVKTSNGQAIRLYDTTGKAGKFKDSMLNNHARMHEMYPLRPPRNIAVVGPDQMKAWSGSSRANGFVTHGTPFTIYNDHSLGIDTGKLSKDWAMPSAKHGDTKNMDYVLTHEYGHQVDFSRNVKDNTYQPSPTLSVKGSKASLSKYGKTSDIESYAEAFAEWHHSNGNTANPTSIAMARSEKWHGSGGISAAATMNTDTDLLLRFSLFNFAIEPEKDEDEGEDRLDEMFKKPVTIGAIDDFENGPKIIGNFKVKEPTAAEIAKAEKIWQQVQAELGGEEK